jgi:lipoic acid synthetase
MLGALDLNHTVITSVDRDDVPDGGAAAWAATLNACHEAAPTMTIEVLVPDFKGDLAAVDTVLAAHPDVFAHNLETVPRLHERIRPAFGYERSLEVLRYAKGFRSGQVTKSNLILGMGENPDEIEGSLRDLADAGCDIVTMGQYLQPTPFHLAVDRWVTPAEFARHGAAGEAMGIAHVEAGPLVRSSYHAGKQLRRARAARSSDPVTAER